MVTTTLECFAPIGSGFASFALSATLVLRIVNQQGRQPTLAEWTRIVGSYCRSIGTHARMGVDNTDLNLLLQLAIQSGK